MKALVAFYSRTGRTKKIAEEIQARLDSDIDEIRDEKKRDGILGWLSAGRDASSKAHTKIKDVDKQPSEYQVVIIGSPTWNGSVSVPIRTYINNFKDDFNQVAIFSTGEGEEPSALDRVTHSPPEFFEIGRRYCCAEHFHRAFIDRHGRVHHL